MEFPFNVNSVLRGKICVVDRTLMPKHIGASDRNHEKSVEAWNKLADIRSNTSSRFHDLESKNAQYLSNIINVMGEASAQAQKLPVAITTEQRLRESENRIYIIKDEDANSGQGAVVGILKVGPKHLFVLDRKGQQYECSPLCILDFYVHESRQRKGYGHNLFQYMLKEEGVEPQHIAVDRPSAKLLAFLQKFYLLSNPIQQPNNFVLFNGFFDNNPVLKSKTKRLPKDQHFAQLEDKRKVTTNIDIPEATNSNKQLLSTKNTQNVPLKHPLYSNTQSKELPVFFARRCFSDEGESSARDRMTEITDECLKQTMENEFHTPTKQLKNSASTEDCNSYRNSSWWKVLGITPRSFDHPNLSKTITKKPDRVQRRLW